MAGTGKYGETVELKRIRLLETVEVSDVSRAKIALAALSQVTDEGQADANVVAEQIDFGRVEGALCLEFTK